MGGWLLGEVQFPVGICPCTCDVCVCVCDCGQVWLLSDTVTC